MLRDSGGAVASADLMECPGRRVYVKDPVPPDGKDLSRCPADTLVSGQGNFGSRQNDPPAGLRYTEARLSEAGAVALAAERGAAAPVPVGLINGNTYREGTRPPFRPAGMIAAIREVIGRPNVTDVELVTIAGPLVFASGHIGRGDLAGLAAGRETKLCRRRS